MVPVGSCYDAKMDGVERVHPPANSSSVVRAGTDVGFCGINF
jgi:hypothetical protein